MSYTSFDFPHTHFYDDDLRELIRKVFEMSVEVKNFVSVNAIKYANPIQWNITSQYEKNTIVIDPLTGTAYISVAAVPSGVALTREDFWTVVFDLGQFVVRASKNFSNRYEQETTLTATFATSAGQWLVWGDTLYVANVNITPGDSYVVDGNIRHITMEEMYNAVKSIIDNEIQARQDADTALQGAINDEVQARQGADTALQSTINDEVQARQNADNAIDTKIGDLANLNTTDKTSVVNAINEINSSGSGAVGRLNNLKLVNVLDYGAIGDDATNDTQAIQDALDYALSIGGAVYFPNGTYLISNTLKVGYGVSVIGENVELTIIHRDDNATGDTMNFGDESTQSPASSFVLKNIWFKRNLIYDESADTFTNKINNALAHVKVYKGQNFVINNCRFWDMPNDLILCGCTIGHVDECWFRPSIYYPTFTGKANLQEGMAALKIDKPTNENFHSQLITINKCYFSGYMTQSQYTQNCLGVNITQDWQCGAISAIEANSCESLIIDGCYFGGFALQNINLYKSYMAVSEVRITNNMFDSAGTTDISISNPYGNEGVNDVVIEHNVFNSQMHGYNNISIPNNGALFTAKNVSIQNNIFANSIGNCIMPTGIRGGIIANNRFTAYNCNGDYDNAILGNTAIYVLGIADYLDIHDNYFGGAINTADYSAHCVNGVVIANGVSANVLINNNRGYVANLAENDQR